MKEKYLELSSLFFMYLYEFDRIYNKKQNKSSFMGEDFFERGFLDLDQKSVEIINEIKSNLIRLENEYQDYAIDEKCTSKNLKKEIFERKIKKITNEQRFFENLRLFSILIYSVTQIESKEINKKVFQEINKEVVESNNIFLKNFYKVIILKNYEKTFELPAKLVNDLFNFDVFLTTLVLSDEALNLDLKHNINISESEKIEILKLQILLILTLSKLVVRNDQLERKVAHYTTLDIGTKLATNSTMIRLNSIDFMNDPKEGKILGEFLNLKSGFDDNPHINTFLSCFTFNHNSLNQFRLYGNTESVECSGMSLVFDMNFFSNGFDSIRTENDIYDKLPLFRCIYLDPFTGFFEIARRNRFTFYQEFKDKRTAERKWNKYYKKINNIEHDINIYFNNIKNILDDIYNEKNIEIIKIINNILKPLHFLMKHFAFQEEQECRVMKVEDISNSEVMFDIKANKSFIEYKLDCNKYLKNIYLGQKSRLNHTHLIKKIVDAKGKLPQVRVSDNPFRSDKKDIMYNSEKNE